jgi:heat shock protein HslJ
MKRFLILTATLSAVACAGGQTRIAETQAAPELDALRNAEYRGIQEQSPVILVDGRWEGPPSAPGGASRPTVTFVSDFVITGDLDEDGEPDAAVLLAGSGGGTGENIYLAVVTREDGRLVNKATALIGDRVKIRAGRCEDGRVVLDLLRAGPADALCCPGELATVSWILKDASLETVADEATGRLSLDVLAGTECVLSGWSAEEPASDQFAVTLVYEENRFAGSNGCNRYQMSVQPGEGPGELAVGPAMSTKKFCQGPEGEAEARFMSRIGGAQKFGFLAGRLAISYEFDGRFGTMFFASRGAAKPAED